MKKRLIAINTKHPFKKVSRGVWGHGGDLFGFDAGNFDLGVGLSVSEVATIALLGFHFDASDFFIKSPFQNASFNFSSFNQGGANFNGFISGCK